MGKNKSSFEEQGNKLPVEFGSVLPNLQERLPFTQCKIVLSLREEEEEQNGEGEEGESLKKGWMREKSGFFVFYEGITPQEKEELKKQMPNKKEGKVEEEVPDKVPGLGIENAGIKPAPHLPRYSTRFKGLQFPTRVSHHHQPRKYETSIKILTQAIGNANKDINGLGETVSSSKKSDSLKDSRSIIIARGKQCSLNVDSSSMQLTPNNSNALPPPPTERMYRCPYCLQSFLKAGGLIDHLPTHTEPQAMGILLKNAEKTETIMEKLPPSKRGRRKPSSSSSTSQPIASTCTEGPYSNHVGEKSNHRPRPFQCPTCEKSFLTYRDLRIHEGRFHKAAFHTHRRPRTQYKCEHCNYSSSLLAHVQNHMKLHTGEGRPFKCSRCSCAFQSMQCLKAHVHRFHKVADSNKTKRGSSKLHDSGQDPIEASSPKICNRNNDGDAVRPVFGAVKLSRCDNLLNQYNVQRNGNAAPADLPQQPQTKQLLVLEENIEKLKPHVGSIDVGGDDDDHHQPGKTFWKCKLCRKRYSSLGSAKRHLNTHSGLRFKCGHCPKTFSRGDTLKEHAKLVHLSVSSA